MCNNRASSSWMLVSRVALAALCSLLVIWHIWSLTTALNNTLNLTHQKLPQQTKSNHSSSSGGATAFFTANSQKHKSHAQPGATLPTNANKTIRAWGCNRTETPFIFVHIAKAGGGSVRARMAASAQNYRRSNWYDMGVDQHYYPIPTTTTDNQTTTIIRGRFCCQNAVGFTELQPSRCAATTPLGQAIGCPAAFAQNCDGTEPTNMSAVSEHVVYVGHNALGHELHWLPVPYLQKWWKAHWATDGADDAIAPLWSTLDGERPWCGNLTRPVRHPRTPPHQRYNKPAPLTATPCAQRLQADVDRRAAAHFAAATGHHQKPDWSAVYASLPVLRVTVVREPFSWLMSSYFWFHMNTNSTCDDILQATYGAGNANVAKGVLPRNHSTRDVLHEPSWGWARRLALAYLYYLCGTDCMIRHYQQKADLAEVVAQAEANLRRSFAVVGLLERLDEFYQMVSARVAYMNTSLHPHVQGGRHSTVRTTTTNTAQTACKQLFQDPQHQAKLVAASPEIAALVHLYKVAVEVNQFQRSELLRCT